MNDNLQEMLTQLGELQSLYKWLWRALNTRNPDNLRGRCDAALRAEFEKTNGQTDSKSIRINGTKVGKLTAKVSEKSVEEQFQITDWDKYEEWFMDGGEEVVAQALAYVAKHSQDFAEFYFKETGETPDGCHIVERETPAGIWMGTVLTGCNIENVSAALGSPLEANVVRMLEGGE